jgi:hypothetical protein
MKYIKALVTYQQESLDIPNRPKYFCLELPDFRAYEPDYTEENRKTIKKFYSELADAPCSVVFDFEVPPYAFLESKTSIPTEELTKSLDTVERMKKDFKPLK